MTFRCSYLNLFSAGIRVVNYNAQLTWLWWSDFMHGRWPLCQLRCSPEWLLLNLLHVLCPLTLKNTELYRHGEKEGTIFPKVCFETDSCCIAQVRHELIAILLPQPLEGQVYRSASLLAPTNVLAHSQTKLITRGGEKHFTHIQAKIQ